MEEKDLKQIKKIVDDSFKENFDTSFDRKFPSAFEKSFVKAFSQVWEDNLEPAFDNVYNELQVIQTKLDRALYTELVHLETRVKRLEQKAGITTPIQNPD